MQSRSRLVGLSRNKVRGFTLLEVVVALAVLAMMLGVVYETLGWSLRRSAVTQQKEIAWLHAQSLLSVVRAQSGSQLGLRLGVRESDTASVKWRIEVREAPGETSGQISESSGVVPLEVTVTVPWGPKPREQIQLKSIELARRAQ